MRNSFRTVLLATFAVLVGVTAHAQAATKKSASKPASSSAKSAKAPAKSNKTKTSAAKSAGAAPAKSTGSKSRSAAAKTSSGKAKAVPVKSSGKYSKSKKGKSRYQAKPSGYRITQAHPTPERYREIQQALADQGFFTGPVDGNWTPDSLAALKRFQQEKNLPGDGKLNSLTLISLGLGPKRTMSEESQKPAENPQAVIP